MSVIWFFFSSRRRHTRWNCDWSSTCALPIFGGTLLHDSVGSHVPPDDHGREPGCGVAIDPPHVGRQQRQRDQLRSEEHTSELQSQFHLVCRLLLEKKNEVNSNVCTIIDITYV